MIPANSVVVSTRATIGRIAINRIPIATNQGFKNVVIQDSAKVLPEFVALSLTKLVPQMQAWATGGTFAEISKSKFCELQIPLPPLAVQQEIVAEIEGYQKVIDGARAVLDHYRPHIPIHPEWPVIELGEICSFKNGLNFDKTSSGHTVKIIGVSDFQKLLYAQLDDLDEVHLSSPLRKEYLLQSGDILFVRSNGNPDLVGRSMFVPQPLEPTTFSGFTIRGRIHDERALAIFFAHFFKSRDFAEMIKTVGQGANIRNLSQVILNELKIPLPPLAAQQAIVAEIEVEQALVSANRELITRFEKKIQATLARVWGEEEPKALDCGSPLPLSPPQPAAEEVASRLATPKRQQAAAVHVETANPKPLPVPEPAELPRPTRPDEMEKSDFMSLLREVLTAHGPCDRDASIKHAATALGYQRVRGGLAEILSNAIRTAVKRQVIFNERGQFSTGWSRVTDYEKDFLKTQFLAAISENGRVWMEREEAIRAFARWLGFRRTGSVIDETARKLISRLLRGGKLESDGDCIRRI